MMRRAGPLCIDPELRLELALIRASTGSSCEPRIDLTDVNLVEMSFGTSIHDHLWALDATLQHDPLELLALTGIARRELALPSEMIGFDWDTPNDGLYCVEAGRRNDEPCPVSYWYCGSLWPLYRWPSMAAFVRWRYGASWRSTSLDFTYLIALEHEIETFSPYLSGSASLAERSQPDRPESSPFSDTFVRRGS